MTDTGIAEDKLRIDKTDWSVVAGANSHVFDGKLMNQFGECVGFVDMVSPATSHLLKAINAHEMLVAALESAVSQLEGLGSDGLASGALAALEKAK